MKKAKILIGLILIVMMLSSANAAWISYNGNQGGIVNQQAVVRQPQITPSYKSPQPLNQGQVRLVKLADTTEILPGGTITYTITAANEGTNTITNIRFIDVIPSYTTFVDAGGSGTITYCHDGRGTNFDENNTQPITHVQWVLGEISPSATATYVLKVRVK